MARARSRRETSAGGVVFRRGADGPVYLLILDSHGNWGFPKGHIERAEQPLEAARREITEETGLRDLTDRAELDCIDWYFRTSAGVVHKFCHLFLFESGSAEVRPQREEGITECGWYSLDEAMRNLAYENSRAILRKASALVRSEMPETEAMTPEP